MKLGNFHKGYNPSPVNHKVASFLMHPSAGDSSLPNSAYVSTCPVMDQGHTNSCVGHAIAAATTPALGFIPSPNGIYTLARCFSRADLGFDPSLVPLLDEGSSPDEAERGVRTFGVSEMIPMSNRFSDADPATVNYEPRLDQLITDSKKILIHQWGLGTINRAEDFRKALANLKRSITVARTVDGAFENWTKGQAPVKSPVGNLGGHYMTLVGYEKQQNGAFVYTVQNSWGTSWGDGGFFLASQDWVDGCEDCFVWETWVTQ